MSEYEFTDDERRVIALYTHKRVKALDTIVHYSAYVAPSVLFACYALWKGDFVAALTAYVALFVAVISYMSQASQYTATFNSIFKKVEAVSAARKSESANEI